MRNGTFIKLHRIKKGITQTELALGIISVSYLSKIENEHTNASTEVITLLCKRLDVESIGKNDQELRDECNTWYSMLYVVNDKNEIIHLYKKIESQIRSRLAEELLMFELHVIRYYLVIAKPKDAFNQIAKLSEIEDTFDYTHSYYWNKFKGNYYSISQEFLKAMNLYKNAEEINNLLDLSISETADLNYTISVTHSKLRNTLETIKYAEFALETFREEYNFIRCAQCHLLLGISCRRIRLYEKALENYNLAKQLGKVNNNRQIIQLANQNLGYLYAAKGKTSEAISHYEEVLKDEDIDLNARLAAITSLIKEYYSNSEFNKTKKMVSQGLHVLGQLEIKQEYQLFYYIIYTYKHVLDGEMQAFEKMVIDAFLPYLKGNKDYVNTVVYTTMLASYYEELHKYKNAVFYHKQASEAYKQLTNI